MGLLRMRLLLSNQQLVVGVGELLPYLILLVFLDAHLHRALVLDARRWTLYTQWIGIPVARVAISVVGRLQGRNRIVVS